MCRRLFLIKLACNFIKNANSSTGETPANETPAQVFFCEIWIFSEQLLLQNPPVAASDNAL